MSVSFKNLKSFVTAVDANAVHIRYAPMRRALAPGSLP